MRLALSSEEQSFLQKVSWNMRKVSLLFHVFVKAKEKNVFVTKRIIAVQMDRKDYISERWCRKNQKAVQLPSWLRDRSIA